MTRRWQPGRTAGQRPEAAALNAADGNGSRRLQQRDGAGGLGPAITGIRLATRRPVSADAGSDRAGAPSGAHVEGSDAGITMRVWPAVVRGPAEEGHGAAFAPMDFEGAIEDVGVDEVCDGPTVKPRSFRNEAPVAWELVPGR